MRPLHTLLVSRLLTRHDCKSLLFVCRSWRIITAAVVYGTCSLLLSSDICLLHDVPGKIERPERLQSVLKRLCKQFPWLVMERSLPFATDEQLLRVHKEMYVKMVVHMNNKIERSMIKLKTLTQCHDNQMNENEKETLKRLSQEERTQMLKTVEEKKEYYQQYEYVDIGDDTTLMRYTLAAARTAAGGACLAVDRVLSTKNKTRNAFCAVRPPGHHAEQCRALGFCVFNNAAVAALHAIVKHGLNRVVIVDLDVHHGNGTQDVADKESRLLYVSMHQAAPCFPNSGFACEKGKYGNVLNVPLRARCTAQAYRDQFSAIVLPRVREFCPQLVIVSMGFDGSLRDPLGDFRLEAHDFYWLTNELCRVAWQCCEGKLVSVMEGGYHLGDLADGAEQHLLALLHGSCRPDGLAPIECSLLEKVSK